MENELILFGGIAWLIVLTVLVLYKVFVLGKPAEEAGLEYIDQVFDKNEQQLIRAWRRIQQNNPERADLILLGMDVADPITNIIPGKLDDRVRERLERVFTEENQTVSPQG